MINSMTVSCRHRNWNLNPLQQQQPLCLFVWVHAGFLARSALTCIRGGATSTTCFSACAGLQALAEALSTQSYVLETRKVGRSAPLPPAPCMHGLVPTMVLLLHAHVDVIRCTLPVLVPAAT